MYNGKELQDELIIGWLDYGARMYVPEIGRWQQSDQLAEGAYGLTSYLYGYNNPVRFLDPNGMYETDGHYWTVYLVGILSGTSNAEEIAHWAEYPDHIMSPDGSVISSNNTWLDPIYAQSAIHSLTGGESWRERGVSAARADMVADDESAFGIALHRLGDSFAHTRLDDPNRMYSSPFGHLWTSEGGHAPEKSPIGRNYTHYTSRLWPRFLHVRLAETA